MSGEMYAILPQQKYYTNIMPNTAEHNALQPENMFLKDVDTVLRCMNYGHVKSSMNYGSSFTKADTRRGSGYAGISIRRHYT